MSILWRVFLSFWCAISVILAVVMFASFQAGTRLNDSLYTVTPLPVIGNARRILEEKGHDGLVEWLAEPSNFPPGMTLYILDEDATDILNRDFPGFLWPRSQVPERITSWASQRTYRAIKCELSLEIT